MVENGLYLPPETDTWEDEWSSLVTAGRKNRKGRELFITKAYAYRKENLNKYENKTYHHAL